MFSDTARDTEILIERNGKWTGKDKVHQNVSVLKFKFKMTNYENLEMQ